MNPVELTPALAALPFPAIDPVAICLGPLAVRWYALAYLAGILLGWWLLKRLTRGPQDAVGHAPLDAMPTRRASPRPQQCPSAGATLQRFVGPAPTGRSASRRPP